MGASEACVRVSVVIAVHDGAQRIGGVVARLKRQTTAAHEIVLVDDGSTDSTADLIRALAADDERVVAVLLPENRGVLRAREAGVAAASGDSVWFIDDDDDFPPTAIGDLTAALSPEVDVVVAGARYVDVAGDVIRTLAPPAWPGPVDAPTALAALLDGTVTGHLWNKLFRTEVLRRMPFTEARVHSDQGMVAAALSRSRLVIAAPAVVYDYHPRGGSIIGSGRPRTASLLAVDAAVREALDVAAPALVDRAAHRYYRTRFIWLSAAKDALQADYEPRRRAELLATARRQLGPRAWPALASRRDLRRLVLAATAWASPRLHRRILSRTDDGRGSAPESVPSAARPVDVFCVGRGQYENIGDAILRRPLIDWARESGVAHVYVGESPAGYDDSLGLQPQDVVYRSFSRWYAAALRSAVRRRAVYYFKPGELQLTFGGLKEHLAMVPLLAVLRVRRGRAVRVGSGSRNFAPVPRALLRPSIALADYVRWRDTRTADYLHGPVMPDLAFAEGAPDAEIARRRAAGRDALVVSMRPKDDSGPRPYPDASWLAAVRGFADAQGLDIWTVAQVRQDAERAELLASDLGGRFLDWPLETPHDEQERRVRDLYARSAIAVSDRLHVLIAAMTEGAAPFAPLTVDSDKIDRHFRALGIEGVSMVTAGASQAEITDALTAAVARDDEYFARLADGRAELAGVRSEVVALSRRAGSPRRSDPVGDAGPREPDASAKPVVWHLGRVGEVAGGMTQVLNSYLAGSFDGVDVRVLTTRGNPGDHAAGVRAFARAHRAIRRMDTTGRTVIVAHVSTGGSFLREGALLRLAARRGLGTIAHVHGSTFAAYAARHPRLVGRVLSRADLVISLSDEITSVSARFTDPSRIVLVPNAVPAGTPAPPRDVVVFGGAVGRRKGVDVLLRAWERAAAPGWRLELVGPVVDSELVESLPPQVGLRGALPHAELMGMLDSARVAVLPSRGEALPMFLLESMARDTCVVATAVGGIPELLADDCGIVVRPDDADALASALSLAMTDASARDRFAASARERYEQTYSAAVVFPELERVWLSVVGGAPKTSVGASA